MQYAEMLEKQAAAVNNLSNLPSIVGKTDKQTERAEAGRRRFIVDYKHALESCWIRNLPEHFPANINDLLPLLGSRATVVWYVAFVLAEDVRPIAYMSRGYFLTLVYRVVGRLLEDGNAQTWINYDSTAQNKMADFASEIFDYICETLEAMDAEGMDAGESEEAAPAAEPEPAELANARQFPLLAACGQEQPSFVGFPLFAACGL